MDCISSYPALAALANSKSNTDISGSTNPDSTQSSSTATMGVQRGFFYDKTVLLPEIQEELRDMYELADINTEKAAQKWLPFFAREPSLWKSGGSATGQEGEHDSSTKQYTTSRITTFILNSV